MVPLPDKPPKSEEDEEVKTFSLQTLNPGETLEIRTRNTLYWVTPIQESWVDGDQIRGMSVMDSFGGFGAIRRSPKDIFVDVIVEKGKPFSVNYEHTSNVLGFRRI